MSGGWDFAQLRSDLVRLAESVGNRPILVHSDLGPFGMPSGVAGRGQLLDGWADALTAVAGLRTLVLPTFNYDWCRTGLFDVHRDPCQVGVLNERLRQRHPANRTATPVFNFLVLGEGFRRAPCVNVLGPQSTFAELVAADAAVVFLGTRFAAGTINHHHEELLASPYRYAKSFSGTISDASATQEFTITYRVRPKGATLAYAQQRRAAELVEGGILRHVEVVGQAVAWFPAAAHWELYRRLMTADPHVLLDDAGRLEAATLYQRYGHPLQWEAVEDGSG
jgi:aminoglycoside N3'-acetyltransferase